MNHQGQFCHWFTNSSNPLLYSKTDVYKTAYRRIMCPIQSEGTRHAVIICVKEKPVSKCVMIHCKMANLLCLFAIACVLMYGAIGLQKPQECESIIEERTSNCTIIDKRFGYNATSHSCMLFNYTNCTNNLIDTFNSQLDCETICMGLDL